MLDNRTLFLKTLDELESRLVAADPYDILLIAGLLRKLFLDDFPLVDRVNKDCKLKIRFTMCQPGNLPKSIVGFWSMQDGIGPEIGSPANAKECNRDQFLSCVVCIVGDASYTIRDIILFEANVAGAVHAGSPKSDKEKALYELDSKFMVGGYASALRQLLAIGRISLRALAPLRAVATGT